jgi:TOMM system kinase/cyclase fusion protein
MTNEDQRASTIESRFVSDAYQLDEKIGQGGFGQVYKARQLNTDQQVAIKFLTLGEEFDDAKKRRYIERFERETHLCSRLQHPNIVRLLDKGICDDDLLYAVFEYVDGYSLRQALNEYGALPPIEVGEVMTQILDALAHAHAQGVIHRDIKPANIMLTKIGAKTHAKVLDFGIGTLVNEARQHDYKSITLTQETLGTPSYSAPEQLRGEPPTPKTDLYVWGLLFIECLTGQPAISGSSLASIFHKQLSQSNVPLPGAIVGHPIAALLRRVLHKKVHERSVTIEELYSGLTQLDFSSLAFDPNNDNRGLSTPDHQTIVQHSDDETQIFQSTQSYNTKMTRKKQVTVLCVCLSVHPVNDDVIEYEIVDTLHRDQKNQCTEIAIQYGAFHVGSLGDTLLFYFGFPSVSKNDTRLCARTALDIMNMLNKRNSLLKRSQGITSQAHIGIHSGLVVSFADATPEGDTPNIAMELARHACANQILCSQIGKIMLENHMEFKSEQIQHLGVDGEAVQTYALLGERHSEAIGFLQSNRGSRTLIGRSNQLNQLQSMLRSKTHSPVIAQKQAITKRVCLLGETGVGKSRLIAELKNKANLFNHHVAQCLPDNQNTTLSPVLSLINDKYALGAFTPPEATKSLAASIDQLQLTDNMAAKSLLCRSLNLPAAQENPSKEWPEPEQKALLFATLSGLLSQLRENELDKNLYIFENLQWADATTLEFISHFINSQTSMKHVFVATSRDPLPAELSQDEFDILPIEKLDETTTIELISSLFDHQTVSKALLDLLVSYTDGNPLFIEELVNFLKQKQWVHKLNGLVDFTSADKASQIPQTLKGTLRQKLDDLGYAKETAVLAAKIGCEFDYQLLLETTHQSEAQLQNDLSGLLDAGLIYQQRKVTGESYLFRHTLIRDAALDAVPHKPSASPH